MARTIFCKECLSFCLADDFSSFGSTSSHFGPSRFFSFPSAGGKQLYILLGKLFHCASLLSSIYNMSGNVRSTFLKMRFCNSIQMKQCLVPYVHLFSSDRLVFFQQSLRPSLPWAVWTGCTAWLEGRATLNQFLPPLAS